VCMMRQPGNSRLFCVCTFECCFYAGSTGFSRKVVGVAGLRLFAMSSMRVVCV
jgi:hypothetical protein